ncbi:MAG: hypothetical protein KDL09_17525 [Prosthecobacter sp.]|nr:hypothetical protein [Prosthecobacter sp.]
MVLGAPRYYERFGFRVEAGLILADVPKEYFMAVAFVTWMPRGVVSYHEAFSA